MSRKLKATITTIIILFLAGIIFYPKLKPLIVAKFGPQASQTPMLRQGQQRLNATGFLLKPVSMSETIRSIGTLLPDEEVDLSFEASGKIVSINFTEGTHVNEGDLLAKINDLPLQAQLQKLEASLSLSEAMEFRQRSLLGRDAISQESYDQIVTEVERIKSDINLCKAQIAMTELRAPFDGIIGLRYISEGAYASPSIKIAKLIKTKPLKIEFSIPERYASEIRIGYPVTFTIDGSSRTYHASVYAIDPMIDINTRNIVLRAMYANDNEELRSGRYAGISLELSKINRAMAIPTESLIPEMDGERVFVFRNGIAQSEKVTIGLRTESNIQVVSGLNFGDTVLTTGILQLRENIPIALDSVIVNN
jgi:membrane fusion protein (multidrug efflux system)